MAEGEFTKDRLSVCLRHIRYRVAALDFAGFEPGDTRPGKHLDFAVPLGAIPITSTQTGSVEQILCNESNGVVRPIDRVRLEVAKRNATSRLNYRPPHHDQRDRHRKRHGIPWIYTPMSVYGGAGVPSVDVISNGLRYKRSLRASFRTDGPGTPARGISIDAIVLSTGFKIQQFFSPITLHSVTGRRR
ncbi:hypothetical protein BJY01DRAFT_250068 [Aspergillus pseudoustus]|uniref:FAD/NAD(P)-binding domain-containing protein n=1 Tax=Aspergillus pseudoustus TaxID=1810923 RepID=A0ABR4JJS5_9EURO